MASLKTLSTKNPATPAKTLMNKLKTLSAKSTENIKIGEEVSLSDSGTSYLTGFLRYSIIFLILAFLGLNIVATLGYLTEDLINLFKPILLFTGHPVSKTVKTVDDIKEDTKAIVDVTKKAIDGANDSAIYRNMDNTINTALEHRMTSEKLATMKSLQDAQSKQSTRNGPNPDEAGSRTQSSQSSSKIGYCYIGEDRGFRSCIKVGENDECISGDIFPTREICINPNLRL